MGSVVCLYVCVRVGEVRLVVVCMCVDWVEWVEWVERIEWIECVRACVRACVYVCVCVCHTCRG